MNEDTAFIKKLTLAASGVIVLASILMAFLAIKPDGLDDRLAFAAILGAILANVVVGLGRLIL